VPITHAARGFESIKGGQLMRHVQYHPYYCAEAKIDAETNGWRPWRWDTSHDLSVIDDNGDRHYVGQYKGADAAHAAGERIAAEGFPGFTPKGGS
jgi:hypothetical protein